MKKIKLSILFGIIVFLLMSTNASAGWYKGIVTAVTPDSNGNVVVNILPGTNETRFTEKSRGRIYGDNLGGKNMYATLLTAISMNKEVVVNMVNTPSLAEIQEITGVALVVIE